MHLGSENGQVLEEFVDRGILATIGESLLSAVGIRVLPTADEPTTALDVTVQKHIIRRLEDLGAASGLPVSTSPTSSAWRSSVLAEADAFGPVAGRQGVLERIGRGAFIDCDGATGAEAAAGRRMRGVGQIAF